MMSSSRRLGAVIGALMIAVVAGATTPAAGARQDASIGASPGATTVGSTVTVSGTGLRSCTDIELCDPETVIVSWDGVQVGDPVAVASDGSITAGIPVPRSTAMGSHTIRVQNSTDAELNAATTVTVEARLSMNLTPRSGPAGSSVTLRGTGYDTCPDFGNPFVDALWNGASTGVQAPIRDGGFEARLTVPAAAPAGDYLLYGRCADSGEYATSTYTVTVPDPPDPDPGVPGPSRTPPDPRPRGSVPADPAVSSPPAAGPSAAPAPARPPAVPAPVTSGGAPSASVGPAPTAGTPAAPPPVAAVGWPRPEIITAIRLLDAPGFPPQAVLILVVLLALLAWIMVGWPAELFHRTFEQNEQDINRWLRAVQRRLRLDRLRIPAGWRSAGPQRRQSWPLVMVFAMLAAVAIGLSEPQGDDSTSKVVVTVLGLFVAVPLVAVSYEFAIESYARLRSTDHARLRIVYPAVVIAAVCATVSRQLEFVPGYAYGMIVAYTIVAGRQRDPKRDGIAVLRASALLIGLALAGWLLRQFGTAAVTAGDDTPFGLRLLDTTLGLITVMSLETLVVGLLPLRFLHGRTLWDWSRLGWLVTYVAGATVFVLMLIGPLPEDKVSPGEILKMLWLFVGFCAGSYLFWGCFAVRDWRRRRRSRRSLPAVRRPPVGRPRQGEQVPVDAAPGPAAAPPPGPAR